jgi:hypothetical protein
MTLSSVRGPLERRNNMSHIRKTTLSLALFTLCLPSVVSGLASPTQDTQAKPEAAGTAKQKKGKCISVGGSISTNLITEDTTLGTVTGDLRGAVSATLLELKPGEGGNLIGRIQHRGWVTESGDTFRLAEALIDFTPVSEGVLYGNYRPITVVSGTGRFENATGTILASGVLDTNRREIVLRYRGEVCGDKLR